VCDDGTKHAVSEIERLWEITDDQFCYSQAIWQQVPVVVNDINYGFCTSKVWFNEDGWHGYIDIHLPTEKDNFTLRKNLRSPQIFLGSPLNSAWGSLVKPYRYKQILMCYKTKNEVVQKIKDIITLITVELSEHKTFLDNGGYYTVICDHGKPGYVTITLYLPTDDPCFLRKDLMDFNEIVFGEKLYSDWGWCTDDQKYRYRICELPIYGDFMKELKHFQSRY
jgi:hypothetical protein